MKKILNNHQSKILFNNKNLIEVINSSLKVSILKIRKIKIQERKEKLLKLKNIKNKLTYKNDKY
jgi:hypothetical protein